MELKKWNRWPGTRFAHRLREFKQGSTETDFGCLFFRILETDWTTDGVKSISSLLFGPPNPFLLISWDCAPLVLDKVPTILATSRGLVLWNFSSWSPYEKFLKLSRLKLALGGSFSSKMCCASSRDSSWTKEWNAGAKLDSPFMLRRALSTRCLRSWSLLSKVDERIRK